MKIHEHTISKEILLNLNEKIRWIHIIPLTGLLAAAIMKTKGKKFGKLLLYNGSFIGILLLVSLIAIKYQKPTTRNKKSQRSNWFIVFLYLKIILIQRGRFFCWWAI